MNGRLVVRKKMKEIGLSVEGLAFKSGRSYSTAAQWLAGKNVTDDVWEDFARVFEMPLNELKGFAIATESQRAVG